MAAATFRCRGSTRRSIRFRRRPRYDWVIRLLLPAPVLVVASGRMEGCWNKTEDFSAALLSLPARLDRTAGVAFP